MIASNTEDETLTGHKEEVMRLNRKQSFIYRIGHVGYFSSERSATLSCHHKMPGFSTRRKFDEGSNQIDSRSIAAFGGGRVFFIAPVLWNGEILWHFVNKIIYDMYFVSVLQQSKFNYSFTL